MKLLTKVSFYWENYILTLIFRFHVGTFGGTESELIWLKNPGGLTPTNENGEWDGWEWGVLIPEGPDVYFEIETMYNSADGKMYEVLLTGINVKH